MSDAEPASGSTAPDGIYVGRSLLTGRAVCLYFLDGGRVTRSIPSGGLENLDWAGHVRDHPGDSGTWEMHGQELSIAWGDGGVHAGALTIRPTGIEFYGKRYSRPVTVEPGDLVGRWESASGFGVAGGEGVVALSTLIVEEGGRYGWAGSVGGSVDEQATAAARSMSGSLQVSGQTITFKADDGSLDTRTFLPVAGEPLEAFSIDTKMFTRVG